MRHRDKLHLSKIEDFAAYCCAEKGYRREPTHGAYEVLRLRRGAGPVVIFHHRWGCDHATVWGMGLRLVDSYLAHCRRLREDRAEAECQ